MQMQLLNNSFFFYAHATAYRQLAHQNETTLKVDRLPFELDYHSIPI
jgi:hypothetical protein